MPVLWSYNVDVTSRLIRLELTETWRKNMGSSLGKTKSCDKLLNAKNYNWLDK